MPRLLRALLASGLIAVGCAAPRGEVLPPSAPCPSAIVLAADGAGNFQASSHSLRQTVAQSGCPVFVETFEWSHGYGLIILDQVGARYAREQGQQLAARVLDVKARCPASRVYLVGHSAGAYVVLAALECLPPDIVERAILLAPSVSRDYDLRPALRAVRCSLDVFCSHADIWYLGTAIRILGTSDRRWTTASGLIGFRPRTDCFEDALLYNKLHQYNWRPADSRLGHLGGHYGSYQPDYLRAYVLPLLQ